MAAKVYLVSFARVARFSFSARKFRSVKIARPAAPPTCRRCSPRRWRPPASAPTAAVARGFARVTESETDGSAITSAVVLTRFRLQASPMIEAASAFWPAVAIITTRSAWSISSIRLLVWPARSASHPAIENGCPAGGPLVGAVKNAACGHSDCASRLTTATHSRSSAITLTERGRELGASIRKRASAALAARADLLCMAITPLGIKRTHERCRRARPALPSRHP